jgi:hypothetical protein
MPGIQGKKIRNDGYPAGFPIVSYFLPVFLLFSE